MKALKRLVLKTPITEKISAKNLFDPESDET